MKQFLPFLTDDQGRSLSVDRKVVVTSSLPNPLDNSPEGWEANTIQFKRSADFNGIIKSYTTPLKFYLDGAEILRNAFYRMGMEVVLFFIWLKLDQSFGGGMQHKPWYKGEPDMSTFKDEYDGVEVSITEGGFYKDLLANKDVVQEIAFDNDAVSLYMDGMFLRTTTTYDTPTIQQAGSGVVGGTNLSTIPATLVTQDGQSYGLTYLSVNYEQVSDSDTDDIPYMAKSSNWMVKNDGVSSITFPLTGKIDLTCILNSDDGFAGFSFLHLYFKKSIDTAGGYEIVLHDQVVTGQSYSYPFSFSITLLPGECIYAFCAFGEVNSGTRAIIIEYKYTSKFSVSATTRDPPSVVLCYKALDFGKKIINKVSPGAVLTSPLLQPNNNLLITSGDAVRSIPDPVMKSNCTDYYKSIDAVLCVEMDVVDNNPVIYDRYDRWDKGRQIASLGECSNWSLEPAKEYIYDSIQAGYNSKTADSNIDVNGKYSFNNGFTWKLNVTRRNVNPYQAKSVYFADPYDIELIRLNLGGKDTTTGQTDNSNFFIDAEPKTDVSFTGTIHFYSSDNKIEFDGDVSGITPFIIKGGKVMINGITWTVKEVTDVDTLDIIFIANELITASSDLADATATVVNLYQLRRPVFTFEGIPQDDTVFNILISPYRNLMRHWRWLRSSCDHLDGAAWIFQTTEKNRNLKTTDGVGNVIDEDADIPVAIMGEKVYLPYYVNFDVASPYNLIDLMSTGAGGKFDYTKKGLALDGFPVEVSTEDVHLETQTYKLLATANMNTLDLINER